jgi:hypothetical protein
MFDQTNFVIYLQVPCVLQTHNNHTTNLNTLQTVSTVGHRDGEF